MRLTRRFRKKGYSFADDIMSSDTIISLIFGIAALICILISLIICISKKGNAGRYVGVILLISLIMSITGLLFGMFSLKQVEGGNNSKRTAIIISIIDLILQFVIYVL